MLWFVHLFGAFWSTTFNVLRIRMFPCSDVRRFTNSLLVVTEKWFLWFTNYASLLLFRNDYSSMVPISLDCCVSSHSLTKTPITKSLCAYLRFTPLNFSIADPALVPVLLNVITISFEFQPLNKSACSELLGQFYNLYSSSYALVQSGPSSIRSNAYSLSTMPRPFDTRAGNRVRPVTKCNAVSLCRFIK